jgi:hypothetical protein
MQLRRGEVQIFTLSQAIPTRGGGTDGGKLTSLLTTNLLTLYAKFARSQTTQPQGGGKLAPLLTTQQAHQGTVGAAGM